MVKYFDLDEFACPCCGMNRISPHTVVKLDQLRGECGFPFKINSGFRCAKHNEKVGGVPNSAHTVGEDEFSHGVDVSIKGSDQRYIFMKYATKYFPRIGIAKTFIHVDDSPTLPQHRLWTY